MAKLLNKETCFKEMLDKRDQIIKGLDKKIKEMENEQKSKTRSELCFSLSILRTSIQLLVHMSVCLPVFRLFGLAVSLCLSVRNVYVSLLVYMRVTVLL